MEGDLGAETGRLALVYGTHGIVAPGHPPRGTTPVGTTPAERTLPPPHVRRGEGRRVDVHGVPVGVGTGTHEVQDERSTSESKW